MVYQSLRPTPPLDRYVEGIWVQEDMSLPGPRGWGATRILPTGKLDLLFFYGDPFVRVAPEGEFPLPRLGQTGQWTRPVRVKATGRSGVVIFSFHPWGAAPFFGLPLCEATDRHLSLDEILPPFKVREVLDRLDQADTTMERVCLLERFLLGLLDEGRHDALVELAVRRINASWGTLPIRRLAESLHLSRRHLTRRFQHTVGLSPKGCARVNRFQKALGMKRLGWDWNRIVERCGHSDQSHFIHEIKAFSGFSPERIGIDPEAETPLSRSFNLADLSHFYNTVYL